MERFDAIVVGAGPAGSTAAFRLSRAGARVLLLDRERFPRDKPCGGGLTARAVRQLAVSVEPVVEGGGGAAARWRWSRWGRTWCGAAGSFFATARSSSAAASSRSC